MTSQLTNPSYNVVCQQQGPPPPNPLVVERFQQVISQLFQQVCPLRSPLNCISCGSNLSSKFSTLQSKAHLDGDEMNTHLNDLALYVQ